MASNRSEKLANDKECNKATGLVNMSGHANFILPNGTWLGANDSSEALGFVVLSPVATLSWEIHTIAELRQG